MELIKDDTFPTLSFNAMNPVQSLLPPPYRAVSTVTKILHFVFSIFFFKPGIYDTISTQMTNIDTENIINQKSVNLIYFLWYGCVNISLLVHSQGGHVLENKHHAITKNSTIKNIIPTMR